MLYKFSLCTDRGVKATYGSVLSRLFLCPKPVTLLIFVFLSCAFTCIKVIVQISSKLQLHERKGNSAKHVKGAQRRLKLTTRPNHAQHPEAKATDAGRKINPMYSQFVKVGKSGKPTQRSHKGAHQNSLKQTSFPQTETGEG